MRQFDSVEEVYDWCVAEGGIIPLQEGDRDKVAACVKIAAEDLLSAKEAIAKKRWNSAYKMHYDVIHQLVEAYLALEKVKIKTHLCLFAYLCTKHPELELNWDFFERIRTKRNGISYYGTPVSEQDWKEVALPFDLYIRLLREKIEQKLNEQK